MIKIDTSRLAELVVQQPDATLKELRGRLGVECAESAIRMALKRLGLSFKKRRSTPRSKTARMWRRAVRSGATLNHNSTRARDVVIMHNLSSHQSEHARRKIESRGARLEFLSPHSPDLNPVEMVFAKVKQLLRTLGCRTKDTFWNAVQSVLECVTPSDAANCFRHRGYTLREG